MLLVQQILHVPFRCFFRWLSQLRIETLTKVFSIRNNKGIQHQSRIKHRDTSPSMQNSNPSIAFKELKQTRLEVTSVCLRCQCRWRAVTSIRWWHLCSLVLLHIMDIPYLSASFLLAGEKSFPILNVVCTQREKKLFCFSSLSLHWPLLLSTGDTNLDVNSPNLHHGKWSSSCCFLLLEMTSCYAWYYLFVAAGISSPHHTKPYWIGDLLKSYFAKQIGFRKRHNSNKN